MSVLPPSISEKQLLPPGLASLSPFPGLLAVCRPAVRLDIAIGNVKSWQEKGKAKEKLSVPLTYIMGEIETHSFSLLSFMRL